MQSKLGQSLEEAAQCQTNECEAVENKNMQSKSRLWVARPCYRRPCESLRGQFTAAPRCQAQEDTAFLALHEGKSWLPQTFDNGPGGGIDDLNQIHDHDLYKNHPGNTQNRFKVKNPHLCGVVMMHVEEIVEQTKKPDSTAGMMRFLLAHFPAVVNKILPNVAPEEIARLLEEDPEYCSMRILMRS